MPRGRPKLGSLSQEMNGAVASSGKRDWQKTRRSLAPADTGLKDKLDKFREPIDALKKELKPTSVSFATDKEGGLRLRLVFLNEADISPDKQKAHATVTSNEGVTIPVDYTVRDRPQDLLKTEDLDHPQIYGQLLG